MIIGIVGLGVVGGALYEAMRLKEVSVVGYDKFKNIGEPEDILKTDITFLCLPTPFVDDRYDTTSIKDVCGWLSAHNYDKLIVLKSTVEPGTTELLLEQYPTLNIVHNPEFINARTALEDSINPVQCVVGVKNTSNQVDKLLNFYKEIYPETKISVCTSTESEMMKIACNSFYAVKVQYFNEVYLLCKQMGADYSKVREMMVSNGWINQMHTFVPGPDGKLSFGGMCLPKDSAAFSQVMKRVGVPHAVLQAAVDEQKQFR